MRYMAHAFLSFPYLLPNTLLNLTNLYPPWLHDKSLDLTTPSIHNKKNDHESGFSSRSQMHYNSFESNLLS